MRHRDGRSAPRPASLIARDWSVSVERFNQSVRSVPLGRPRGALRGTTVTRSTSPSPLSAPAAAAARHGPLDGRGRAHVQQRARGAHADAAGAQHQEDSAAARPATDAGALPPHHLGRAALHPGHGRHAAQREAHVGAAPEERHNSGPQLRHEPGSGAQDRYHPRHGRPHPQQRHHGENWRPCQHRAQRRQRGRRSPERRRSAAPGAPVGLARSPDEQLRGRPRGSAPAEQLRRGPARASPEPPAAVRRAGREQLRRRRRRRVRQQPIQRGEAGLGCARRHYSHCLPQPVPAEVHHLRTGLQQVGHQDLEQPARRGQAVQRHLPRRLGRDPRDGLQRSVHPVFRPRRGRRRLLCQQGRHPRCQGWFRLQQPVRATASARHHHREVQRQQRRRPHHPLQLCPHRQHRRVREGRPDRRHRRGQGLRRGPADHLQVHPAGDRQARHHHRGRQQPVHPPDPMGQTGHELPRRQQPGHCRQERQGRRLWRPLPLPLLHEHPHHGPRHSRDAPAVELVQRRWPDRRVPQLRRHHGRRWRRRRPQGRLQDRRPGQGREPRPRRQARLLQPQRHDRLYPQRERGVPGVPHRDVQQEAQRGGAEQLALREVPEVLRGAELEVHHELFRQRPHGPDVALGLQRDRPGDPRRHVRERPDRLEGLGLQPVRRDLHRCDLQAVQLPRAGQDGELQRGAEDQVQHHGREPGGLVRDVEPVDRDDQPVRTVNSFEEHTQSHAM